MAGLTAAWELSRPGWREELSSITVYQRGAILGGKGASTRGVYGRIEEHGLHVWMGYYQNAFRLLREVYGELDRPMTDPACPIQTVDDAFFAAGTIGVDDSSEGDVSHWVARFSTNRRVPGHDADPGRSSTTTEFVEQSVRLLATALGSVEPGASPRSGRRGVFLTSTPHPPGGLRSDRGGIASLAQLGRLRHQAEVASLIAGMEALAVLNRLGADRRSPALDAVMSQMAALRADVAGRVKRTAGGRRLWQVVDLVLGCALGALADDLLAPEGFARVDHLDFREWLAPYVAPETLRSPLMRGLYDLVFAYEEGDSRRPRFSAGLGLFLASRLFLDYDGSIFWKMRAGMGDVVFAPLYQGLRARGVHVAFFHRVEQLGLDAERRNVESISLQREAELADGCADYDPLVRIDGLPCFPTEPRREQLARTAAGGTEGSSLELRFGRDFDNVVLAVSLGMLPVIADQLIEHSRAWKSLVANVGTVATQSLQLWLRPTEEELGWRHPGATVSGYEALFDTYSSMSHLVDVESWPDNERPGTVGYFCSALPDALATTPEDAAAAARRNADEFLADGAGRFWPEAAAPGGGFRRELLCGRDGAGMYVRANTDPSDRYVQSLPGTGAWRLQPDQSGFDNLVLAGDWTNCGLNAGCVEAAVMSGIEAANAVMGRPLPLRLAGRWYGLSVDASPRQAPATVAE